VRGCWVLAANSREVQFVPQQAFFSFPLVVVR
jgi:hypothetical protein